MPRLSLLFAIGLFGATLTGQRLVPPPRPVMELRLALARFNNGTAGFTPAELGQRMIGFSQAARSGEFALAYFEDRGDNKIHPPLHLAISTSGKPWARATITAPANIVEAVGALFIGKDYLLANTGTTTATRQLAVFDKSLKFLRAVGGNVAIAPLPNDVVVYSQTRTGAEPAMRSTLALFDVHSGAVTALYPGATPVTPSASYAKLLIKLVADLNQFVPNGNSGRGYRTEWYAAFNFARPEYDPVRDALTFIETIAPTWPLPALPQLSRQVESFQVTCGPLRKPAPRCVEGPRTIAPFDTRGR